MLNDVLFHPGVLLIFWKDDGLLSASVREVLACALDTDDRKRLVRFRKVQDQYNFLVSRFLIRTIAARQIDCAPSRVAISYGPYGKPFIPESGFHFNLSHSGSAVLLAIRPDAPVGVDIEYMDADLSISEVAQQVFTLSERQFLAAANRRRDVFFRLWTLKESYMKLEGRGFSLPPTEFSIRQENGPTVCLERPGPQSLPATLRAGRVYDNYCYAVATAGLGSGRAIATELEYLHLTSEHLADTAFSTVTRTRRYAGFGPKAMAI